MVHRCPLPDAIENVDIRRWRMTPFRNQENRTYVDASLMGRHVGYALARSSMPFLLLTYSYSRGATRDQIDPRRQRIQDNPNRNALG
jgi:hypothetical protein